MLRWKVALLSTLCGLAVAIPTASAEAKPAVLTLEALGGKDVALGDIITSELQAATNFTLLNGGAKGVTCGKSSIQNVVTANPETAGVAKSAELDIATWTVGKCNTNVVGAIGVESVSVLELFYVMSLSDAAGLPAAIVNPGGTGKVEIEVVFKTLLGKVKCIYQTGELKGNYENFANRVLIKEEPVAVPAGSPALCPTPLKLTAGYAPMSDQSEGGKAVFVN
jgi:hypothetical protein